MTTMIEPFEFDRSNADLMIRVAQSAPFGEGVCAWKLMDAELFPVASPTVAATLRNPADLAEATLLHSAVRPHDWARWLMFAGVAGVDPAQGLKFETKTLAYQAAIEGLGVAVGMGALVLDDLAASRLVCPFPDLRRPGRPIYLVTAKEKADTPEIVAVRDWLLEEARANAHPW